MANQIVAFQDERHGLGAWVAEQVAAHMFRYGIKLDENGRAITDASGAAAPQTSLPDPTQRVASAYGVSLSTGGSAGLAVLDERPAKPDEGLDYAYRTWTSPRTTAEATFSAVIARQAQVGVVPLYDNDLSFNRDTLSALVDFPQNKVLREYVAESNYVLAVPTDLVHEIEQSGYADSFAPTGNAGVFRWNREKQQRYLRKVTRVYAPADAMKHCAAAIDGLKAKGVDVQLLPDGVDTYREGLRIASGMLDPHRIVETQFSGTEHTRVSKTRGGNHTKPVIGVLLSHDKAMSADGYHFDSDYVILESEMAGADRIRSSFIAMTKGKALKASPKDDPAQFEMAVLRSHFVPAEKSVSKKVDSRALYPLATDTAPAKTRGFETPALVRALYMFNTVGEGARDYSSVLKSLTDQGLSFRLTSLDNRPGQPLVVAVDVPATRYDAMKPVLKEIMSLPGARRLADFPALRPMVDEGLRPQAGTTDRSKLAFGIIALIFAGLVGFVLAQTA
ncbi:hypothetical protein [Parvularcula sp. LCG005]|uniref:hypothetical protein n=1 Tax=Parvularcula sp. LCG005 TaxID=3078805 RepID=UPI002942BEC5|nr:hypothetical protein [Parvularcula sp. LCG005]WOI53531.1 hypothetical protein RUI03_00720 [Parvularcula sp. LCG005]